MCLLHNSIIRGFNSIYQQAPHVPESETAHFIGYALTWHRFVESHHDDEEANLFTKVEEVLDDKNIWAETHEEHGKNLSHLTIANSNPPPLLIHFHDEQRPSSPD